VRHSQSTRSKRASILGEGSRSTRSIASSTARSGMCLFDCRPAIPSSTKPGRSRSRCASSNCSSPYLCTAQGPVRIKLTAALPSFTLRPPLHRGSRIFSLLHLFRSAAKMQVHRIDDMTGVAGCGLGPTPDNMNKCVTLERAARPHLTCPAT
jgi:hypothetical protein